MAQFEGKAQFVVTPPDMTQIGDPLRFSAVQVYKDLKRHFQTFLYRNFEKNSLQF